MSNVTLIGMPGSGKTTVGQHLARHWGWDLLDTDWLIEQREGKRLEELIESFGHDQFLQIEAKHVRSVAVDKTVIATGGSVVYDDEAMQHLRQISTVVYLDVPLLELEQRVGDLKIRGVVIAPGMSVAELWRERDPLYRRYADLVVDTRGNDPERSAREVINKYQKQEASSKKQE